MSYETAYILDNDGTLLRFDEALSGAQLLLTSIIARRIPFVILSNSGEKDNFDICAKLSELIDIDIDPSKILTAKQHLVKKIQQSCSFDTIYILSSEKVYESIDIKQKVLLTIENTPSHDESKTCICVFSDGHMTNYIEFLNILKMYIIYGAKVYFTSADMTLCCKHDDIILNSPGPGMFVENLKILLRGKYSHFLQNISVFGKGISDNGFVEYAENMLYKQGFTGKPNNIKFIGDRFDTDMRAGKQRGMNTVLVETGCHKAVEQYLYPEDVADCVVSSLNDILYSDDRSYKVTRLMDLFQRLTRLIVKSGYTANSMLDKAIKDVDAIFSQPRRIRSCTNIADLEYPKKFAV